MFWKRSKQFIQLPLVRQLGMLTVLFGGVLIVTATMHHLAWAPVEGHSITVDHQIDDVNTEATPAAQPTAHSRLTSQYFQLVLPADFHVVSSTTKHANLLYSATLSKQSMSGSLIASLSLKTNAGGSLDEDSNYRLRVSKPAIYQAGRLSTSQGTLLTERDDSTGQTMVFWQHGGLLATVSVVAADQTSSSPDGQAESVVLQQLINAWQWQ